MNKQFMLSILMQRVREDLMGLVLTNCGFYLEEESSVRLLGLLLVAVHLLLDRLVETERNVHATNVALIQRELSGLPVYLLHQALELV